MTECPVCHKVGFHKLSCPTQKATVFISGVKVEGVTAESDGVSGKHEGATKSGMSEIPTNQSDEKMEVKHLINDVYQVVQNGTVWFQGDLLDCHVYKNKHENE